MSFTVKVNISQLLTVAVLQFIINDKTLHLLFSFIHWELLVGQSIDIIKFVKYDITKSLNKQTYYSINNRFMGT